MKSLIIAFAMYSKFPMPRVDWEKKALSWALCWFPLVGLAVGAVLWLWLALAGWLDLIGRLGQRQPPKPALAARGYGTTPYAAAS